MIIKTILAESRQKNKTVLIERAKAEFIDEYHVLIDCRFHALDKAKEFFLSETPGNKRKLFDKQIDDSNASFLRKK